MPDHFPIPVDARSVSASSRRSRAETDLPAGVIVFDGNRARRVTDLREEEGA